MIEIVFANDDKTRTCVTLSHFFSTGKWSPAAVYSEIRSRTFTKMHFNFLLVQIELN